VYARIASIIADNDVASTSAPAAPAAPALKEP
jgi:hypothetical protein